MSDKKSVNELFCFYVGDEYWTISVQRLTPQLLGWVDRNIRIIFFYPKLLLRKGEVKHGSRWLIQLRHQTYGRGSILDWLPYVWEEGEVEYLWNCFEKQLDVGSRFRTLNYESILMRVLRENGSGLWLIKYMDLINLVRIGAPIPNHETLVHGKLVYRSILFSGYDRLKQQGL